MMNAAVAFYSRRNLVACAIITHLLWSLAAGPARAEKRVALVIGNQAYTNLSILNNPVADASSLATLLAVNGFDVISCDGKRPGCFDVNRDGMLDALETLKDKSLGADLVLIFYTGHGMEGREGNLLAPIDTSFDCTTRTVHRAVLLSHLLKSMERAQNKLVILDGARNDPIPACPPKGFVPVSCASFDFRFGEL